MITDATISDDVSSRQSMERLSGQVRREKLELVQMMLRRCRVLFPGQQSMERQYGGVLILFFRMTSRRRMRCWICDMHAALHLCIGIDADKIQRSLRSEA